MKKIIILDYATAFVSIHDVPTTINNEAQEVEEHFNITSDMLYMVVDTLIIQDFTKK